MSLEYNILELSLLDVFTGNSNESKLFEDINEIVKHISTGCYENVLSGKHLVEELQLNTADSLQNIWESLPEKFRGYVLSGDLHQRSFMLLCIGISSLQLYVRNNYVGPSSPDVQLFGRILTADEILLLNEISLKELFLDGEIPYHLSRQVLYLVLANIAFNNCYVNDKSCLLTISVWQLRLLRVWQMLLEERAPTLKTLVLQKIDEVFTSELTKSSIAPSDLSIQLHLESGYLCYYYYEFGKADEHFNQALSLSGLTLQLTGLLGKRTKYQETDLAQLVLTVGDPSSQESINSKNKSDAIPEYTSGNMNLLKDDNITLPKDVRLEHEYLLSKTEFKDTIDNGIQDSLTAIQQAVILAVCFRHRKSHESISSIVAEEALAYITSVLRQPRNWCVQSEALYLRSQWEWDSVQRMERSISQLEELTSQFERASPAVLHRLPLIYAVWWPPKWKLELTLADLLMKAGAVNGACEIYTRLHQWEQVIQCYAVQGRRERAEELIREQLKRKETPNLWCHLGDVTAESEHYETAWTLSSGKYSRAQKSLGFYYLHKAKFADCLPHFEKSLAINTMQIGVWFSYGCALLACERYEEAAKAFRRCVNLDSDNFEAWSNLALAYVRSNQKPRAFISLQEALKCEYENWRLWENYLLVGTDVGEFDEVIRAYNRLLDIKEKYTDTQVLSVIAKYVNNLREGEGQENEKLRLKLLELFGRLTSKVTTNGDVWRLYSCTLLGKSPLSVTDRERAVQYLQKAQRCATQTPNWESQISKCIEVAKLTTDVAKELILVGEKFDNIAQANALFSSAKMMLRNTSKSILQKHTSLTGSLPEELQEPCKLLEETLQIVIEKLEHNKT